ncbi:MAG: sigma 54-interacting transcriptional regulator [Alteromonadaceae bacterium]|nr:sigma 54-interacting transcriptional regulator [Alteromonadaceae bacterium]
MRLAIHSTDRIGISQEILSVFAQRLWNIKAVEVEPCLTYVHITEKNLLLATTVEALSSIKGVKNCDLIDLLPAERNAKHLTALLARIPDPIVDIDHFGNILAVNHAVNNLCVDSHINFIDTNIVDYVEQDIVSLLSLDAKSIEINFMGIAYIADITPVLNENRISGAVLVLHSMNTLGRQVALLQNTNNQSIDNILGQSAQIKTLKEQALRFAELELSVLITGETGTGKELFARALHEKSPRSKAPFLAINCAALPENLLESELFGYAVGAFSGAKRGGKPGLFELASGGTVFLDEIAEMSVYLQAKLLRFLQDYSYRRVGGTKELKANVRIVCASHQNLLELVEKKFFREDLFYRINVLNLKLPPLKDRYEDISLLAQDFIQDACLQTNQQGIKLSEEALLVLQSYNWPGNIRQLQNILFSVVALASQLIITGKEIKIALSQQSLATNNVLDSPLNKVTDWSSAQAEFEINLLAQLYPLYPTTRKLAARLNVSHNKIAMKLKLYGLNTAAN